VADDELTVDIRIPYVQLIAPREVGRRNSGIYIHGCHEVRNTQRNSSWR
jgi:hypothetical protein